MPAGGMSKEDLDLRRQNVKVSEAAAKQALELVYATRVGLGLPPQPYDGNDLAEVPPDLGQTFSGVRSALSNLVQTMAQIGLPLASSEASPHQVLDQFRQLLSGGQFERSLEQQLIPNAPAVKQAEAGGSFKARRDLEQAELNRAYCNIFSEIDGVVTRRNVNPGNNVQPGQSLMAVRSLTEIWIDANFKETQLADLRIGQRVRCEVDMYGGRHEFEGRISGFTMGTGQTLSLLPAQNATGNFVKVIQRLPVRIELIDYDPDRAPLFAGLSVVSFFTSTSRKRRPARRPGIFCNPTSRVRRTRRQPLKRFGVRRRRVALSSVPFRVKVYLRSGGGQFPPPHSMRRAVCPTANSAEHAQGWSMHHEYCGTADRHDRATADQSLVRRRGRGRADVHGSSGLDSCQRCAALHGRWLVGGRQ